MAVKKSIDIALSFTQDDDTILNKVKSQYGNYFSDDELKEFIAQAKGKTLQGVWFIKLKRSKIP